MRPAVSKATAYVGQHQLAGQFLVDFAAHLCAQACGGGARYTIFVA
jgi:hypothetical protein